MRCRDSRRMIKSGFSTPHVRNDFGSTEVSLSRYLTPSFFPRPSGTAAFERSPPPKCTVPLADCAGNGSDGSVSVYRTAILPHEGHAIPG